MVITTSVLCLALNIFHEARGESVKGQQAIAQVTVNRAVKNYDGDVCGAVFDYKQFSWTYEQHVDFIAMWSEAERLDALHGIDYDSWQRSLNIAVSYVAAPTTKVMFYHETHVHPRWRKTMKYVGSIGRHVFYAPRKST